MPHKRHAIKPREKFKDVLKNARKFLVAEKFPGIFLFVSKIFPIFAIADLRLSGSGNATIYRKRRFCDVLSVAY